MRKIAREYAFQLIYEFDFLKERNESSLSDFCLDVNLEENDVQFLRFIYDKSIENHDIIFEKFKSSLKDLDIKRVFKADLAIARLAICEIDFCETPVKVAINEAIEIAKKFSSEKSAGFINGVLASIYN